MQTELITQLPFGVSRVQAATPITAVSKESVQTVVAATAETNQQNPSHSISKEKAQDLEKEINSLNKELSSQNVELNFSRDDKTGVVIMKIIDKSTGDALRQIPSEVSLRLAEAFSKMQIHLFSSQV